MKESIVFGILARNCAKVLSRNIDRIENLGSRFSSYNAVILENNSTDRTKEVISRWTERNDRIVSIIRDDISNISDAIQTQDDDFPYPLVSPKRIGRMVKCRNILLNEIRSRFQPDIVCIIDSDIYGFDTEGVISAIKNAPEGWGALFANGTELCRKGLSGSIPFPNYYDSYAYLPFGADYRDPAFCKFIRRELCRLGYEIYKKLVTHDTAYLPVESAFGGIGVYKFECISNLDYETVILSQLADKKICVCEHVPFNSAISAKGYGLYIAREMKAFRKYFGFFHTVHTLIRRRLALGFWPEFNP